MTPKVRGIRGATEVSENTADSILAATEELLKAMVEANDLKIEDIASIFLTATPDLDAEFPAYAARKIGWKHVPLMCAREIAKPGAMKKIIRILIHTNTNKRQNEIKHQYLGATARLRPDLSGGNDDDSRNEI